MIDSLALKPFFLKAFHVRADIGSHGTNMFQYDFPQDILPDIMGGTGSPAAFILGANVAILAAVSVFTGVKVESVTAVGAVYKS